MTSLDLLQKMYKSLLSEYTEQEFIILEKAYSKKKAHTFVFLTILI